MNKNFKIYEQDMHNTIISMHSIADTLHIKDLKQRNTYHFGGFRLQTHRQEVTGKPKHNTLPPCLVRVSVVMLPATQRGDNSQPPTLSGVGGSNARVASLRLANAGAVFTPERTDSSKSISNTI